LDGRTAHSMTADERLDEMILESFPASDPPSYWAGDPHWTTSCPEPCACQPQQPPPIAQQIEPVKGRHE
jgi:hypothetical protein